MFDLQRCAAIDGWMLDAELQWLHDRAAACSTVLEVGCWKGRSAMALGQGCRGRVYTVDHFRGSPSEWQNGHGEAQTTDLEAIARANLRDLPHVVVLALPSQRAADQFLPGALDMVFIDGEHTQAAVELDLLTWGPKAARLLCGHDRTWPGVAAALVACGIRWQAGPGSLWFTELAT